MQYHCLKGFTVQVLMCQTEGLSWEGNVPLRTTIKRNLTGGTVLDQECTNHMRLIARATKFCTVTPNILS